MTVEMREALEKLKEGETLYTKSLYSVFSYIRQSDGGYLCSDSELKFCYPYSNLKNAVSSSSFETLITEEEANTFFMLKELKK